MQLIVRLASQGLIHGDYNEFNILVYEDGRPILIDFPQMVSIDHPNAQEYFERDVQCIRTFFTRKFRFEADGAPAWGDVQREGKLDIVCEASGYGGKLDKDKEMFHREVSVVTDNYRNSAGEQEGANQEDEDEEEENEGDKVEVEEAGDDEEEENGS
jgi:RIO kinase 2